MLGTGIASSLVHEVGHQAAALLDLANSLRPVLHARAESREDGAWQYWENWISEIVADLWSVARLGIGSSAGLMSVVSLPRAFVFRINRQDPHPIPWTRMRLSCAIGEALYADPQWQRLSRTWALYYPVGAELNNEQRSTIAALERSMPEFIRTLLAHRPKSLRGDSIGNALRAPDREPGRLRADYRAWRGSFEKLRAESPARVFALLGQARSDAVLQPDQESRLLADLLTWWALRQTLDSTTFAAIRTRTPAMAAVT
jgi:hypothetical protein